MPTKVNAVGFQVELSNNINFVKFYDALKNEQNKEIIIHGTTSVHYITVKEDYIVGLILTYKNHRRSIETSKDEDGNLIIGKLQTPDGSNGTEASLFAINPSTKRGVIFTYFGSISIVKTKTLFKRIHDSLRKTLISEYVEELEKQNKSKKIKGAHKKANEHFNGEFDIKLLVSPTDIDNLLKKYKSFTKVEIRSIEGLVDSPTFSPVSNVVSSTSLDMNISSKTNANLVMTSIKALLNPTGTFNTEWVMRIIGKSHQNEDLSLQLGENKDDYGKFDYDDYVDELPSEKWVEFPECKAMARAISTLKKFNATFGIPTKAPTLIP